MGRADEVPGTSVGRSHLIHSTGTQMCIHYGDPREPCPLCECNCKNVTGLYAQSGRGITKGHHKRFFGNHGGRGNKSRAAMPQTSENDKMLAGLLRLAISSGATGDDLVKIFIDSNELATAIVVAQVQKALAGNMQSANWLFSRGIGTAQRKSKHNQGGNQPMKWLDPLASTDDLYEE